MKYSLRLFILQPIKVFYLKNNLKGGKMFHLGGKRRLLKVFGSSFFRESQNKGVAIFICLNKKRKISDSDVFAFNDPEGDLGHNAALMSCFVVDGRQPEIKELTASVAVAGLVSSEGECHCILSSCLPRDIAHFVSLLFVFIATRSDKRKWLVQEFNLSENVYSFSLSSSQDWNKTELLDFLILHGRGFCSGLTHSKDTITVHCKMCAIKISKQGREGAS